MTASHIGSQINSAWGKLFGKETATGGATAFRKAAVSAVHRNDKGRREELAQLMAHQKATAGRYYLLEEKTAAAVKTSKYLTDVLHAKAPNTKATSGKDVEASSAPSSSVDWSAQKRRKWMHEEEEELKTLFAAEIKDQSITLNTVRKKIQDSPVLKKISVCKIRDKIRTFFGSVPCPLPELPEETPEERLNRSGYKSPSLSKKNQVNKNEKTKVNKNISDSEYTPSEDAPKSEDASPSIISPSTCTSRKSSQKLFDKDEHNEFCKLFKDLINSKKPITRIFVKETLEGAPKLGHLLKRCTLLQLAEKVRTERNISKRNNAGKCK